MAIKIIPLSRLETDLKKTLTECVESGDTVVVEMPDQRLLAIQSLDPHQDDSLIDELLASNPKFQALVAKSKASPRKPFVAGDRFTVADITALVAVDFAAQLAGVPADPSLKNLARWHQSVSSRPSAKA